MDEIVFEQRNKSYGAFELRQLIDRHKIKGLLIAIAFFTFVVLASQFKIFAFLGKLTKEKEVNIEMTDVELPPPPPPPVDAPPPPPPPPPPVRPTKSMFLLPLKKVMKTLKLLLKKNLAQELQLLLLLNLKHQKNQKFLTEQKLCLIFLVVLLN